MLLRIFSGLDFLKGYSKSDFFGDLLAGITVAVMIVPQSMAYAMIAGFPPVYGLYASTIPLIVYPLFGSSRHLAVGPAAIIALMTFVACSRLASPGTSDFIAIGVALTLLVGVIKIILGFLKMGFLANYFSEAVSSGFISAGSIIIIASQIKHLFGIPSESYLTFTDMARELVLNIGQTNPYTLLIGAISILLLYVFRLRFPSFPAPLLVVIIGIFIVRKFDLHELGVATVGDVPIGLPYFRIPEFALDQLSPLVIAALLIVFVSYLESLAMAQIIADKENYKIDPDRELKGLGYANLAASFFASFPVSGGISRTAVNYRAGAKSGMASILTATLVILTLIYLTPFFHHLPLAALASNIIFAISSLVDYKKALYLYRIKPIDGVTLLVTFVTTLAFGVERGLIIGILFSLVVFIWRSAHPYSTELGFVENLQVFRNKDRFPESLTFHGVVIFRIDGSLFFANMGFVEEQIRKATIKKEDLEWVILDFSGVNDIDAVSIRSLDEILQAYLERGVRFAFSGMKGPIRDLVHKAGWNEKDGVHLEFLTVRHALHELKLWDRKNIDQKKSQTNIKEEST